MTQKGSTILSCFTIEEGDRKLKPQIDFNMECNTFSAKKTEDIAFLYFTEKFLIRITDLSVRDRVIDYLDLVSKSKQIKVLVIYGSPEKRSCDEYFEFYRSVSKSELGLEAIQRMYNVINQIILKLITLDKIVIHVNSGNIISSFLNISLACDYRIIADSSVFMNPCIELGLLPKGGGAFFLPRMIGSGKALEVLLSERDIDAYEALELGIVNKIVPLDDLEAKAFETATYFRKIPSTSLTGIKRLLNYSLKELKDYLEYENEELLKVICSSSDWKNFKNHF